MNLKGRQNYVPSVLCSTNKSHGVKVHRRFQRRMTKIQAEQVSETSEQDVRNPKKTGRSQEQGAERSHEKRYW